MTVYQNAVNANQEGVQYRSTGGVWSGVDGISSGYVLTSNGPNVAPSFQAGGGSAAGSTSFLAYLNTSVSNVTGDTTNYSILFDTLTSNIGSAFTLNSSGKSIFTAPATGVYNLSLNVTLNNLQTVSTTDTFATIVVNGVIYASETSSQEGSSIDIETLSVNVTVPMSSGSVASFTVAVAASSGGKTVGVQGIRGTANIETFVSGFRIS